MGHESLAAVFKASESNGLPCKLTGAGGGGCAMTLLPQEEPHEIEGKNSSGEVGLRSVVTSAVDRLKVSLSELGFEAFESSLAGDGVQWP